MYPEFSFSLSSLSLSLSLSLSHLCFSLSFKLPLVEVMNDEDTEQNHQTNYTIPNSTTHLYHVIGVYV